jgi:uncharacterized membrane protein YfcA
VATLTAPVGISGAVFLLPIQLSVLNVPNPAVTPTNPLFNIVSIPGALARYRRRAPLCSPLTALLLAGTLPGVIAGAAIRVFAIPGPILFRLFVASLLFPLGVWLCLRSVRPTHEPAPATPTSTRSIFTLALTVGVVGGIYGIGGGSLLSPILVGRGMPVAEVAPAALTSTFVTSIVGAATYTLLALTTSGHDIAPDWAIGIICGVGGLCGGYLGAHLQPLLPEKVLRAGMGISAIVIAALYAAQALACARAASPFVIAWRPVRTGYDLSGSQADDPRAHRAGLGAEADCLRPDDSTSTDRTTATKSSTGTSPNRCPIWCPLPKDCTAMIAACTTLDHTVNQIRLRLACGFRAALRRKTPSVAYTPTIIMK